ncbi:hypothetical protein, partial [Leptotrichia sp. OH3620_COT-345]|uniref:hypothetical protein n=1 Tax=Leptotrichia sp. OH3620_COT-345 TaxID=2491048 RepID=UPI001315812B
AGNKVERVSEILKAVIENKGKSLPLYYKDRLAYEEERDRLERSGKEFSSFIDKEKAKEVVEQASGMIVDDVQVISSKDPNIKEIIGADGIRGRAYHVGNGKVVIIADNIGDYAKAIGVLSEEGRHLYHRRENGLKDSEDYASFYGRQFE